MEKRAIYKGNYVEIMGKNGGWSTILLDSGATRKVRNGELSPIRAPKATPTTRTVAPAAKKVPTEPAAETPKKADDDRLVSADLNHYVVSQDIRTASGRRAVDSDDAVARELRGMELADVYERAAQELDVSVASLHKLYDHLNAGMQRMNLGNRIRGAIKARSS